MIDVAAVYEKHSAEYAAFDKVLAPLSQRRDLCALMLLEKLCPGGTERAIGAAEHDFVYFDFDCDDLANTATEDDILTLVRCGVSYVGEYDCLGMHS